MRNFKTFANSIDRNAAMVPGRAVYYWSGNEKKLGWLVGKTETGKYIIHPDFLSTETVSAENIAPVKVGIFIKTKSEIIEMLQKAGYKRSTPGHWGKDKATPFTARMFDFCDCLLPEETKHVFKPEWLEYRII